MNHTLHLMAFHRAAFLVSAATLAHLPPDRGIEVAIAGRSNAGKSSALNAVTGHPKLARTSKTPGCTRQINVFTLAHERRLVDLPGYGYARVPEQVARRWQQLVVQYLEHRRSLTHLVLVMDVRHPLSPHDQHMLGWCGRAGLPVHLLLNKADKLSHGAAQQTLQRVQQEVAVDYPVSTVQLFSARLKTGIEELRALLATWLDLPD